MQRYYFFADQFILSHKKSILLINKKMYVSSKFLNGIYDITQVVVKSANFMQNGMTYFNVMPYSITLLSDMDYDFLVED